MIPTQPKRTGLFRFGVATVVVLLTATSACSSDQPVNQEALDAISSNRNEIDQLERQKFRESEEMIRACMKDEGHRYNVRDPDHVLRIEFGWTQVPVDQVDQYGYGITVPFGATAEAMDTDPNEQLLATLTPSEEQAWQGSLQGTDDRPGCLAAGQEAYEVTSDKERVAEHFADGLDQLIDRVLADERIADAETQWSECMSSRGFEYEFPTDPIWEFESALAEAGDNDNLADVQERERSVAAADAACPFNNFGSSEELYDLVYEEEYEKFVREHEGEILAVLEAQ